MKFTYGEFDGSPFPTPDSLFAPDNVMEFILKYGQQALDALGQMKGDDEAQYIQSLIDAGLLEIDKGNGEIRLTPKMLRGIQHRSFLQLFEGLQKGNKESHTSTDRGRGDERIEGTKAYEFGDPLSEIDVAATMRNAMARQPEAKFKHPSDRDNESPVAMPSLDLNMNDFELHLTQGHTDVATCILIDLSGSMIRNQRFYHAKRVALGMASMIRQRFPQDTVDYVGFYSLAKPILERELPLIMPMPISTRDYSVRIKIPLDQAQAEEEKIPRHFTNLHMGLRLARQILSRRGAANKQIFVITDGQPTAHIEPNAKAGGEMLHLIYPPSQKTTDVTLQEAFRCRQAGIRMATFALIEDYWGMDWVGFVDQLSRLTRGTAFYCAGDNLGSTVIESYLAGKRKRSFIS